MEIEGFMVLGKRCEAENTQFTELEIGAEALV